MTEFGIQVDPKKEEELAQRAAELLRQQQAGKDVSNEAVKLGQDIHDTRSGTGSGSGNSSSSGK